MNNRMPSNFLTALVLGMMAGTALPALAHEPAAQDGVTISTDGRVDFRSASWLADRKVVNNNGEVVGQVSELILDRGSGRIEFLVIKTGSALGGGRQAIAIPYSAFRAESGGTDRYVLASTAEQLKQCPEYSDSYWMSLKDPAFGTGSPLRKTMDNDPVTSVDPYAGSLSGAERLRVEGEVTGVERVRTSTYGEQVVVTVNSSDGSSRKIAMGPSWFVNSNPAAPMRGDKVVVETLVLPRDPDRLLVATSFRADDRSLRVRGSDGAPAWGLKTVEADGKSYGTGYSRYLLLSKLPGMTVDCRGVECGKVNDVIVDRTSGEIGFLSIDPNENFLGINDTKRLIPWSVATVVLDGKVRIDASKEMVLASPETPADVSVLNTGTRGESVYKAFGVPVPRYEAAEHTKMSPPRSADAWSATGPICESVERGPSRMIEGKVTEVTEVRFERGIASARAVKIRTTGIGAGEELVLLGPVQYIDGQKPMCKVGDTVKIDASRATIDGQRHWLARSVDCDNARSVLLDGTNAPVWAQR